MMYISLSYCLYHYLKNKDSKWMNHVVLFMIVVLVVVVVVVVVEVVVVK